MKGRASERRGRSSHASARLFRGKLDVTTTFRPTYAAQANAHAHTVKFVRFWILYWIVEEDACAGAGEP